VTPARPQGHGAVIPLSDQGSTIVAMAVADGRPEVLVFVIDAGGGHRAAANALVAAAEAVETPFRLRVVNLQEVFEPLDPVRRLTGRSVETVYNALLRRSRTRHLVSLLRVFHAAIRLRRRALVERLARFLSEARPGAVLSVLPNFNGVIRDAVAASLPGSPFVVLLTDFADFPPHFWIEPGIDRVIAGSDLAAAQALEVGLPPESIARASGMVLHPRFYPPAGPEVRARLREELRIPEDAFAVLVLFGGKGSAEVLPLSGALLREDPRWHVLTVCGDNAPLHESLGPLEAAVDGRLHRFGFTDRVAELMAASDVVATKPGPGTLAEAFHQRVPVVVPRDVRTVPQERYNARLVDESCLGLVVPHWSRIPAAVARMQEDEDLRARIRKNLAALPPNRAVFEVLDLLAAEVRQNTGAAGPR
jgi:1,2-diacylglycerol 3-beta-galactosyltransferase